MTSVPYWAESAMNLPYEKPAITDLTNIYTKALIGKCLLSALCGGIGVFASLALLDSRPPVPVVVLADYVPPSDSLIAPEPVARTKTVPAAPVSALSTSIESRELALRPSTQSSPSTAQADSPSNVFTYLVRKERERLAAKQERLAKEAKAELDAAKPADKPAPAVVAAAPAKQEAAPPAPTPKPAKEKPPAPVKVAAAPPPAPVEPAPRPSDPNKPVDRASSAKFGVANIAPEGLILFNGMRVAVGSRLPNGEVVQRVDPAKGRIETDQRIMQLTD